MCSFNTLPYAEQTIQQPVSSSQRGGSGFKVTSGSLVGSLTLPWHYPDHCSKACGLCVELVCFTPFEAAFSSFCETQCGWSVCAFCCRPAGPRSEPWCKKGTKSDLRAHRPTPSVSFMSNWVELREEVDAEPDHTEGSSLSAWPHIWVHIHSRWFSHLGVIVTPLCTPCPAFYTISKPSVKLCLL